MTKLQTLNTIPLWQDSLIQLMSAGAVRISIPDCVSATQLFRTLLAFEFDATQCAYFLHVATAASDHEQRVRETRTPPSQIAMETNVTQALASPETDERPRTNVAIQRAVRDGLPTPKQRNAKAHSNARQLKAKVQAFWERVCAALPHEPVHTNETVDRDRGVAALKSEVIAPTPLSSLPWTRFVAGRNASRQPNDTRMTRWPVYGS